jgi:mannose-6-phosphate isomerase-like protein (cupin superfamily)
MMKNKSVILKINELKKFDEDKRYKENIWSDDRSNISMICMRPGQEVTTHTHHFNHVWLVVEGQGEFTTAGETQVIESGQIVIVPPLVDHGIRNGSSGDLVIASITGQGD